MWEIISKLFHVGKTLFSVELVLWVKKKKKKKNLFLDISQWLYWTLAES